MLLRHEQFLLLLLLFCLEVLCASQSPTATQCSSLHTACASCYGATTAGARQLFCNQCNSPAYVVSSSRRTCGEQWSGFCFAACPYLAVKDAALHHIQPDHDRTVVSTYLFPAAHNPNCWFFVQTALLATTSAPAPARLHVSSVTKEAGVQAGQQHPSAAVASTSQLSAQGQCLLHPASPSLEQLTCMAWAHPFCALLDHITKAGTSATAADALQDWPQLQQGPAHWVQRCLGGFTRYREGTGHCTAMPSIAAARCCI